MRWTCLVPDGAAMALGCVMERSDEIRSGERVAVATLARWGPYEEWAVNVAVYPDPFALEPCVTRHRAFSAESHAEARRQALVVAHAALWTDRTSLWSEGRRRSRAMRRAAQLLSALAEASAPDEAASGRPS